MSSDAETSAAAHLPPLNRPQPGTAFALGWLMAQIYGSLAEWQEHESPDYLPIVAGLGRVERVKVAFAQLTHLARPFGDCGVEDARQGYIEQPDNLKTQLRQVHYRILENLAADVEQQSAYQLGQALSDTCWLPTTSGDGALFFQQFERHRLALLRSWITQAGGALPPQSGAVAARSLQSWQDWADINAAQLATTAGWATNRARVADALENQGRAWRALLTSPSTGGLPGVNAWIRAGESVLRTVRSLARQILLRFWGLVLIILAVTGALLYLAVTYAHGVAKYWTSLVTLVGAFGVSGASLRAAGRSAAQGIEQEVWNSATLDARAWEVTWLPALVPSLRDRFRLYRRGVSPPQIKSGLEAAISLMEKEPPVSTPAPSTGTRTS
jgi:hypothetical protein